MEKVQFSPKNIKIFREKMQISVSKMQTAILNLRFRSTPVPVRIHVRGLGHTDTVQDRFINWQGIPFFL